MKKKGYKLFLTAEGIVLILISAFGNVKATNLFDLLALPLSALANFLGELSLSSAFGNAVAIILYSAVCLVPVFVFAIRVKKRIFRNIDGLLILLSAVMFAVVYLMINPSEMGVRGEIDGVSSLLAVSVYSVLFGYLLLNFTANIENIRHEKTEKILCVVLKIIGAVFVFSICSVTASEFFASAQSLTENSNGNFITVLMLVLESKVAIFPNIFGIWVAFSGLDLLDEMSVDRYSENTVVAAEKLSEVCIKAIRFCTFLSVVYNVLQLRFIAELPDVNFTLQIPLLSFGFILVVLVMVKYLKDAKALKEDNDSFI